MFAVSRHREDIPLSILYVVSMSSRFSASRSFSAASAAATWCCSALICCCVAKDRETEIQSTNVNNRFTEICLASMSNLHPFFSDNKSYNTQHSGDNHHHQSRHNLAFAQCPSCLNSGAVFGNFSQPGVLYIYLLLNGS